MAHYDIDSLTLSKNGNTYTINKNYDVLDFESISYFPQIGEEGKVYIAKNTNVIYRWDNNNSEYVSISSAGGYGVIEVTGTITNTSGQYSESFNDERITANMKCIVIELSDPSIFAGLISVTSSEGAITISCDNVSGTSTFVASFIASMVSSTEYDALNAAKVNKVLNATSGNVVVFDANGNIADSGKTLGTSVPADAVFTDTTYSTATHDADGLMSSTDKTKLDDIESGAQVNPGVTSKSTAGLCPQLPNETATTKYLRQDGSWEVPPDTNTTYGTVTSSAAGLCPALATDTSKYLRADGSWATPPDNNTTYSFSNSAPTLAWNTTSTVGTVGGVALTVKMPANPNTNTTYGTVTSSAAGLCPALATGTSKYLRADGSWATPPDNNTTYSFTDKNVTLAWGTTHTIATVGGTNIRLTMPSNPNTNTTYAFTNNAPTLAWNTTSTVCVCGGVAMTVKLPANPNTNTTYSFTDKNVTLAWGTTHTIAVVGGTNIRLTMPANPNTNTWRGIQNNLTSTSTTDSLSANQGRILNNNKVEKSQSGDQVIESTGGVVKLRTASYELVLGGDGNLVIYNRGTGAAVFATKWYHTY